MNLPDAASMALGNLARRKGRTALTLVGVVIGAAAVVLLVSLGIGLKLEVLKLFQGDDELRTLRATRTAVADRAPSNPFAAFSAPFDAIPIGEDEIADLARLPGVDRIVPDLNLILDSRINEKTVGPVPVAGAAPGDDDFYRRHLLAGRIWSGPDEPACLFPSHLLGIRAGLKAEEALGRTILFSRGKRDDPAEPRTFTITGVIDSDRLGMRGRQLYLPWGRASALRELTKGGLLPFGYEQGKYLSVEIRATDTNAVEELKNRLRNLNYQVLTSADIIGTVSTVFIVVEGFMACIGAIGLVVSLFGIANTMAMSVLERTREIGVLKALGARNADIRRIFLLEAGTIGLLGGLLGLALGAVAASALSWVVRSLTQLPDSVTLFHVSSWLAAGAVAFSVAVSVVAGLLPALRASRLDPVRALRDE